MFELDFYSKQVEPSRAVEPKALDKRLGKERKKEERE